MKINKLIIRIAHFFGYMSDVQHMDDILVNISSVTDAQRAELLALICTQEPVSKDTMEYLITAIKDKLKNNHKLREACNNVNQVWCTLSEDDNYISGSVIHSFNYVDGCLTYVGNPVLTGNIKML